MESTLIATEEKVTSSWVTEQLRARRNDPAVHLSYLVIWRRVTGGNPFNFLWLFVAPALARDPMRDAETYNQTAYC
jgi:hypothetical protein